MSITKTERISYATILPTGYIEYGIAIEFFEDGVKIADSFETKTTDAADVIPPEVEAFILKGINRPQGEN